ncbi:hypothetical protein RRF57_007822 [Xylaria bambusicola]|uniref:Uncharacterized protein n=1 Tax=Xylaria bambusicola TaxID=326684 RepID=A0AAN7ZB06_9PEZI
MEARSTKLVFVTALSSNDTLTAPAPPATADGLAEPLGESEAPVSGDEDTREHVDDLDEESEDAVAALLDGQ